MKDGLTDLGLELFGDPENRLPMLTCVMDPGPASTMPQCEVAFSGTSASRSWVDSAPSRAKRGGSG